MNLPKCVYFKHGAYWLVKRGRWLRLTADRIAVEAELLKAAEFDFQSEKDRVSVLKYLMLSVARSRANAKGRRGLTHTLTKDEAVALLEEANWKCAVTGTPFSLEVVGPRNQRPYAPSIDRLDNADGYSKSNCRIVCAAVNIAMNTWGSDVLLKLAKHAKLRPAVRHLSNVGQVE